MSDPTNKIKEPDRATIDMHRALQFIRPLLLTIQTDQGSPAWRRSRATAAIAACDTAMITADMDFPDQDFYA